MSLLCGGTRVFIAGRVTVWHLTPTRSDMSATRACIVIYKGALRRSSPTGCGMDTTRPFDVQDGHLVKPELLLSGNVRCALMKYAEQIGF